MTEPVPKHKRSTYFVKKDFQAKFIIQFCLLLLLGAAVSSGLLLFFCRDTLTSSFAHSRLVLQPTGIAILPAVILTNCITFAIICLAAIAVTLLISHRIAGPLFRFEKELRTIGSGDLTRKVTLRRDDQTAALAGALSDMVASLHERVSDIRQEADALQAAADRGLQLPAEVREGLDRMRQKLSAHFQL